MTPLNDPTVLIYMRTPTTPMISLPYTSSNLKDSHKITLHCTKYSGSGLQPGSCVLYQKTVGVACTPSALYCIQHIAEESCCSLLTRAVEHHCATVQTRRTRLRVTRTRPAHLPLNEEFTWKCPGKAEKAVHEPLLLFAFHCMLVVESELALSYTSSSSSNHLSGVDICDWVATCQDAKQSGSFKAENVDDCSANDVRLTTHKLVRESHHEAYLHHTPRDEEEGVYR